MFTRAGTVADGRKGSVTVERNDEGGVGVAEYIAAATTVVPAVEGGEGLGAGWCVAEGAERIRLFQLVMNGRK